MVTEWIKWRVPRGPKGLMGWYLASSNTPVIPAQPQTWIVADGESGVWQVDGLHTSGDWHVVAYNTGAWPHTIYLEFGVRPIAGAPLPSARLAPLYGLAAAAEYVDICG